MSNRPNYTCPNDQEYVDGRDRLDVSYDDKYDYYISTCNQSECEYAVIQAEWGGSGHREVWGSTIELADGENAILRETFTGDSETEMLSSDVAEKRHPGLAERLKKLTEENL